jgi:hypothetical protein
MEIFQWKFPPRVALCVVFISWWVVMLKWASNIHRTLNLDFRLTLILNWMISNKHWKWEN